MLDVKTVRKRLGKLNDALIEHHKAIVSIKYQIEDVQNNCPHGSLEFVEDLKQQYICRSCSDCGKVLDE